MIEYLISFVYYVILSIISFHVLIWLGKEVTMGICHVKRSLKDKVVLITGGNNGIGFETSLEMARRGAKLIIGCRNTQNVEDRIKSLVPGAEVEVVKLDLSLNSSIRKFADHVKSRYEVIDVLINNAGMVTKEKKESEDGFGLVMATNHLGHALLNHLLLDLVKRAGQSGDDYSRIIIVSSGAAGEKNAAIELCQPRQDKKSYKIDLGVKGLDIQYEKSKLAQVMYGKHLAKVLEDEGCNTFVATLHPGFVRTDIFQGLPEQQRKMLAWFSYVGGKTSLQGAQTTIYLAVCNLTQDLVKETSGTFFSDCRPNGWPASVLPKCIHDPIACKGVWDETMRMLKI